jgi:hypothetical protein
MSSALAALFCLTLAVDQPAAPPAADAPPKIQLDFKPTNLQITNYVSFDDKGQPSGGHGTLYANFNVYGKPADVRIIGREHIKITKMIGSNGQSLALPTTNGDGVSRVNHRNNAPWLFAASISMPLPPENVRSIAEISGSVTLWYAAGASRVAMIGPYKEIVGRNVRVEGLSRPATLVVHDEKEHHRIRLDISRSADVLIDRIRAYDAAGRELNLNENGQGGSDNVMQRYLSVQMPDDARLAVHFFEDARSVQVPFRVMNIPLPQPPKGKGAEIVVKALPPHEVPPQPAAPPDLPPAPPLKVIVQ